MREEFNTMVNGICLGLEGKKFGDDEFLKFGRMMKDIFISDYRETECRVI